MAPLAFKAVTGKNARADRRLMTELIRAAEGD